jgi:hypothetical protein
MQRPIMRHQPGSASQRSCPRMLSDNSKLFALFSMTDLVGCLDAIQDLTRQAASNGDRVDSAVFPQARNR